MDSAVFDRMVAIRRDLYRHPDLSWQERRTAKQVGAALDALGIPHRPVLVTGVVADLPGPTGVPVIALRSDLEALPAHSSRFDFDERALAYGATWFREVALEAGRAVQKGGNEALRDAEPAESVGVVA